MDLDFDSDIDHSFDGSEGTQEDTEEELWFTDETTWSEPELESGPEIQLEVLRQSSNSHSVSVLTIERSRARVKHESKSGG